MAPPKRSGVQQRELSQRDAAPVASCWGTCLLRPCLQKEDVLNYEEVRDAVAAQLAAMRDAPTRQASARCFFVAQRAHPAPRPDSQASGDARDIDLGAGTSCP